MIQKVPNESEKFPFTPLGIKGDTIGSEKIKRFTPNTNPEAMELFKREIQMGKPVEKKIENNKNDDTKTTNKQ
jgi:hypothetical protein